MVFRCGIDRRHLRVHRTHVLASTATYITAMCISIFPPCIALSADYVCNMLHQLCTDYLTVLRIFAYFAIIPHSCVLTVVVLVICLRLPFIRIVYMYISYELAPCLSNCPASVAPSLIHLVVSRIRCLTRTRYLILESAHSSVV